MGSPVTKPKERIAFIGVGMVGVGEHGRGLPAFSLLLKNLSVHYEIVVYRLTPGIKSGNYEFLLRSVPAAIPRHLQYLFIIARFLLDHLQRPFRLINALSPIPAGRIAVGLKKILRIPVIVHLHAAEAVAFPEFNYGDLLHPQHMKVTQGVCQRADVITMLSESQREMVMSNLQLARPCKIICHGVNTHLFTLQQKKATLPFRVLYIGYNEPVKDPQGAIEVFRLITQKIDATLTMLGSNLSPSFFNAQLLNDNLKEKVFFSDSIPHEKMKEVYAKADLLLVTSRYESQSSVAIEAMASGVLVAGTRVGILADLPSTICITVPPKSYSLLAKKIIQLYQARNQQQQLISRARAWAEAHDHLWTAHQYEILFETITKKKIVSH